jgi:DNA-binding protein Fis
MIDHVATPLREWIDNCHGNNITHAAQALGVDRSTLHRVMNSAYVIDGVLYTIKRRFK